MPTFKHPQDPNHEPPDNGHRHEKQPPAPVSPIVPGRQGRPSFSLEALRERIERQFQEETAHRADILLELDTENRRRALLHEVADYVLAVEAVTLAERDKNTLIDSVYRNLFGFGPLDAYVQDEAVTEITVNGPHDIHVRARGVRQAVDAAFDDRLHLATILQRILAADGVMLSPTDPFLEAGLVLGGRTARISIIAPPVSPDYSLEIRLHPRQPLLLNDLHTRLNAISTPALTLLRAIMAAQYGLLIVGEAGVGKTTLAGALAQTLPETGSIHAVERAAELHLPAAAIRHTVSPPRPDDPGCDFMSAFQATLAHTPDYLIADEIRGDASTAVWDALTRDPAPQYLWVFRGDSEADRLRNALSMVIRKQNPALDQQAIHRALARHLPFVAAFTLRDGAPHLHLIAEWVLDDDAKALMLRPLVSGDNEQQIENRPLRTLDWPDK